MMTCLNITIAMKNLVRSSEFDSVHQPLNANLSRPKSNCKYLPRWLISALCVFVFVSVHTGAAADEIPIISLAGEWQFQVDRENVGLGEAWFSRPLTDSFRLPGSLPAQGIGDEVSTTTKWMGDIKYHEWFKDPLYVKHAKPGDFRFPFWLQPDNYYAGAAWYQSDIEVPANWQGKRISLTLERPHWATKVWIDDQEIGANDSLSTPHMYNLGTSLTPGKHRLTIRVDNSLVVDIGINSHSISDHTQGNWNGIVGRLELAATSPVWIDALEVFPDVTKKQVRVRAKLANATQAITKGVLTIAVESVNHSEPTNSVPVVRELEIPAAGSSVDIEIPLGDNVRLWDEFSPALYRVSATLKSGEGEAQSQHVAQTTFGLREVSTAGTQFLINGRKTFFRGTLECAVFPATGHPPTDIEAWKRIIGICQTHGLNMIRFHSWCPPEAAFEAADELGFYYQVEAASWANQSTTIGDGKPVDEWVHRETNRILETYGNHPSFVLMTYGNEPGGPNHETYLSDWVNRWRRKDPRRLYSSASGWPQLDANQFHITPDPRIHEWGAGLNSRINVHPPETQTDYRDYIKQRKVPVISHEIGQWCVYPNFDEMAKYTGYLKPKNFAIFRDSLSEHAMGDQARDFLMASGELQTLCYKEDIEAALRTPGMGGFQLLGLNDFPGQGTALVGTLDPFWDSKGYVSADEYRRFCSETVALARVKKRVFTSDESIAADLEVANFGAKPYENATVYWKVVDEQNKAVAQGELPPQRIPIDNGIGLGHVDIPLSGVATPAKYKLVVGIADTRFENDWDVWVYPPQVDLEPPADVVIVDELTDRALAKLNEGGKVLLTVPPSRVKGDKLGKVALGFSSIFWNTAWTDRQPPHTLGILCDPKHPLFADFPTDSHTNWQWSYLIRQGGAMILDGLPAKLRPVVQVIDDWVTNRRLGLLFEAKVGSGRLLVCSIDLDRELNADPVRRQFRYSVLKYMGSERFAPEHSVTAGEVRALMTPASPMNMLGAVDARSDSEEPGSEAVQAIDGDPQTIWHTQWRAGGPTFPHSFQVEFRSPISIRGFTVLPRQDGIRNGWINDYLLYASDDAKDWGQPIARGSLSADNKLKTVELAKPVTARFFRLMATSGFDTLPYASLAEFSVLPAEDGANDAGEDKSASAIPAGVHEITVDGAREGLRFDGVGGVSSGGSSRLLVDYPERQRNEILDYLFKPNYGAALQILKVEIGADTDATAGAEPSHMRSHDKISGDRGYEWWLMKEAKARNPNIKLYGLAWGAPGWFKNGFWSDDNIRYTIAWLDCAKGHGLHIDYLGGGNERGWDAEYYVKLAKALKDHGYGYTQVVATDDHNPPDYWSVADEMQQNPEFTDAVDIVGQHDVCAWRSQQRCCFMSEQAASLGKPLWDSENSTQDYLVGAGPLARVMNRHYIDARITGNLNWALVGAYYGNFPAPATGLVLADRPWSGYYDVSPIVWVNAHTTQFVQPGWRYLDDACGYTPGGASYVTLRASQEDDFTTVIETLDLAESETIEIRVGAEFSQKDISVWTTDLSTEATEDDFIHAQMLRPSGHSFRLTIEPGRIYTLSTTRGQFKGKALSPASVEERMPLPYREDFEDLAASGLAPYFADVHGGFEAASCAGGREGTCYRQVIRQEPILWHGAKMPPTTLVGDPLWWGDYEVSVDALLEKSGYVELLGRVESQQHNVAGYHFQVSDTGAWRLTSEDVAGAERVLGSGQTSQLGIGRWHRLGLRFVGDEITPSLDGVPLASVRDGAHTTGQVGLRVSAWQNAQFDNLAIFPTSPAPEYVPHSEMTVTASSEHAENDFGSIFTAKKAIDDRVETLWKPEFGRMASSPQWITLDLQRTREISGLAYKPPVANTRNTAITSWSVSVSQDNQVFEEVAEGYWELTEATKIVRWPVRAARYVRLAATGSRWPQDGVAVSELNVLLPGNNSDNVTVNRP
jgi:hypothetical protein